MAYEGIYGTPDPHAIVGHAQAIRSDEWNVATPFVIGQHQLGFPRTSPASFGGVDATLKPDLPTRDWTVLLRPQQWGFLFLPFVNAFAWKWWFSALALIVAAYVFTVLLLPRYPLVAAATAIGFFFSPFIQWWYQVELNAPLAWAFTVMAVAVWLARARTRWGKVALAGTAAYATSWAAVTMYPPFIVPCAWVVIGFVVGWILTRRRGERWRARLSLAAWLAGAGATGLGVVAAYAATRWSTLHAALTTTYPGQRLIPTGDGLAGTLRAIPWTGLFSREMLLGGDSLGVNDSESSAFVLVTLFLLPVASWCLWRVWRDRRLVDWTMLGSIGVIGLLLAFMYVPGWNSLAHLLALDRSTYPRIAVGLGLGAVVLPVLVMRALAATRAKKAPWPATVSGVVIYFVATAWVMSYAGLHGIGVPLISIGTVCLALGGLVLVLYGRGRNTLAAVTILAIMLAVGAGVHPLNRGLFDLRTTESGKRLIAWAADHPGGWVALGNFTFTPDLAIAAGLRAWTGFQFAPNHDAWHEIDPTGEFEDVWNRLAVVWWEQDSNKPRMRSPQGDMILVNLDPCAQFEQRQITNIFASVPVVSQCAVEEETWIEGQHQFFIYSVVPPG
jgi:hypothetical protein